MRVDVSAMPISSTLSPSESLASRTLFGGAAAAARNYICVDERARLSAAPSCIGRRNSSTRKWQLAARRRRVEAPQATSRLDLQTNLREPT